MSVKDVIKKSVLESEMYHNSLDMNILVTITIDMLLAVVFGLLIYWAYKQFYKGVIYSRNFATSLVGMCILTCMVTLAISTNIVISLGMVGALSIVRFRTAVKEPLDLIYMFWSITTGITVGAGMYTLAAIAFVIMLIVVFAFSRSVAAAKSYILVARYDKDVAGDLLIRSLYRDKYEVRSKIMRDENTELTIQFRTKKLNNAMIENMRNIDGIVDLAVLSFDGEYHG